LANGQAVLAFRPDQTIPCINHAVGQAIFASHNQHKTSDTRHVSYGSI